MIVRSMPRQMLPIDKRSTCDRTIHAPSSEPPVVVSSRNSRPEAIPSVTPPYRHASSGSMGANSWMAATTSIKMELSVIV